MPPFGFHLLPNSVGGDWLPWAATGAPDVKVCDAALIWPAQQLGARVFWRPCFLASDNGEGDCGDGAAWGANVIAQITSNGNHWPEMIGFRNEMNPTAANAAQYQRYRAVLRAAGYAGLVVYGSFGNGRPDWPEYATIPTDADALELHEYWTDTVAGSPDLALRHVEALRRGLISPTMTLYLGEIGDWKAGQGWQGNSTPAQMTEQLSIFRAGCAPSVVAAFVFADGNNGDPQWNSFTTRATPVEATIRVTWPTTPKGATVLSGIDVSSMQPGTDWQQVAQTHQFAFVKATESTGYVNPYFGRDWAGAKQNGLVRAAYDFAQPSFNSPEAEVDYLLSVVGVLDSTDNIALDLEVGNGDLRSWAERWVLYAQERVGFKSIYFYSYPSFLVEHNLLGSSILGTTELWYASYQSSWPPVPAGWNRITVWQGSDNAVVPGVAGIVDENYTTLTIDELKALGKPAPVSGGTMDALTYYQQLGIKIDPAHAIFTACLKPMYDYWLAHKDDVIDGVVIGDLIKPGALVYPEYGAIWGNDRPAAQVKLQNRIAGVYQDEQGSWANPYQASLS